MNKGYLISLSKGANAKFLTMANQRGQPRIMCFEHLRDARRCKDYIIAYKTAYGHWPSLDMSIEAQQIEYKHETIKSNKEIYNMVDVTKIDDDTFNYYCNNQKMNFLLCKSFNAFMEGNRHNLDFTGEEYVCEVSDDMYKNVSYLNKIYDLNNDITYE